MVGASVYEDGKAFDDEDFNLRVHVRVMVMVVVMMESERGW